MIDHQGLLSLSLSLLLFHRKVSTKGLKLAKGQEPPVICFAREDYRVITRDVSQGSSVIGSKTRKHLASRITFLNWGSTFRNLRGSSPP